MTGSSADIGVIGLAVMGRNLVLNMADHGHRVAVFNRSPKRTHDFLETDEARARAIDGCESPEALAAALRSPRAILLMVKAGRPVDDQIDELRPFLAPGDLIIDGGNAHYADTARRAESLADDGLLFVGAGISGGESGARHGPAIMAGGDPHAYDRVASILTDISAEVGGEPCCAWLGPGGAGHFVKMVHNGIEYAVMQAISEVWLIMRDLLRLDRNAMQAVFERWSDGPLGSYLIEITADILATDDAETGRPLLELIADRAGHKGTGRWTGEAALELGIAAPTLIGGFMARALSADQEARNEAAATLVGPNDVSDDEIRHPMKHLEAALHCATIVAYGEGFRLLLAASRHHGWALDLATVAKLWRGGCIIRARLLETVMHAYRTHPDLPLLIAAPPIAETLNARQTGWRRTIGVATAHGVPVPALSSALATYDGYRTASLWTSMVQAQRDYFGAHTYERTDRPGSFHTDWLSDEDR